MMSERKFANTFTSFWNALLPTGDRFIRLQNLQLSRFSSPVGSLVPPGERGVVSELGFRLFCHAVKEELQPIENVAESTVSMIAGEATDFIRRFRELSRVEVGQPSDRGRCEAIALAEQLRNFVARPDVERPIVCCPDFKGCGLVDFCSGDLLAGQALYEVKAVDRSFRLVDLRQVLTYCALNYASKRYDIKKVGLLNPRRGVFFIHNIDWLCHEVAGSGSIELLSEIVEFCSQSITSGGLP